MSKASTQSEPEIEITQSEGLDILRDLRRQADHSKSGNGPIFGADWIAVGDDNTKPYECSKAVRFGVIQHLKGGESSFAAHEHGYMTVFEPMNRKRALKKFNDKRQQRIKDLNSQLETANHDAVEATRQLEAAQLAAHQALSTLQEVEQRTFGTKKARTEAEKPYKTTKKAADRALKSAQESADKVRNRIQRLTDMKQREQYKLDDTVTYLHNQILQAINNRTAELEKETDPDKRAQLKRRLASERTLLKDPIKSLMANYLNLNVLGLLRLRVNGKRYVITTPPEPRLPEKK